MEKVPYPIDITSDDSIVYPLNIGTIRRRRKPLESYPQEIWVNAVKKRLTEQDFQKAVEYLKSDRTELNNALAESREKEYKRIYNLIHNKAAE